MRDSFTAISAYAVSSGTGTPAPAAPHSAATSLAASLAAAAASASLPAAASSAASLEINHLAISPFSLNRPDAELFVQVQF